MLPHHNILNVRMLRYNVLEHPKTSVAFALRSRWAGGNYSPLKHLSVTTRAVTSNLGAVFHCTAH